MEKKPKNLEFSSKTFKAQCKWSIPEAEKPVKQIFAVSRHEFLKTFILSKNESLSISEDFEQSNTLSDIKLKGMQVLSIDFSPDLSNTILCTFSSGHILIMDPIKRSRGEIKWINNKKMLYSQRYPLFCRWVSETSFLVLFSDNVIWKFDKDLKTEDENFIKSCKSQTQSQIPVFSIQNPDPNNNPLAFWKLSLGRISEMQVSPKAKSSLFGVICPSAIKVIDFCENKLVVTLLSYFAGFQCITWSPDGEVLLAGGEDDCIHAWSARTWTVLFKGVGHLSWVSCISCYLNDENFVIFSVGQDGRLLIWEQIYFNLIHCENEENFRETDLVVSYPDRLNQNLIEPILDEQVSSEPLIQVCSRNKNIFVFDNQGTLNMWSKING